MSVRLVSRFSGLAPYVPGEQPRDMARLIKLNTNESAYAPPEAVVRAAEKAARGLNLYCDTEARELCEAFARRVGVRPSEVLPANGSDEILYFAFLAFGDADHPMMYPDVSYGFYSVYANVCGAPRREVPVREDFSIDYRDYMNAGANVVIANPNAPTGVAMPLWQAEAIVRSNPDRLVLIDEAYVDFGGESCAPLIRQYDNLLVTRTFSKSYSLAGARLGFGVGCEALIARLRAIKNSVNPYNVNSMTQAAGLAALESEAYFREKTGETADIRDRTAERLRDRGFFVTPSRTNFVFFGAGPIGGEALYRGLRERGVLVRHFDAPRVADFVRMSMGTREQMDEVLSRIDDLISQEKG